LKSPALSDAVGIRDELIITLPKIVPVSAIGIGNTDGKTFIIKASAGETFNISFSGNGLYPLGKTIHANKIVVSTDGSFIGRLGAGLGVRLGTSVAKQPAWRSTAEPRTTLSGQIVLGAGGYNYRTLHLDTRYKLKAQDIAELEAGYKYSGLGFPFFIDLTDEAYKLPYSKLYATDKNQRALSLEGGLARFLYSKRFEFEEAF